MNAKRVVISLIFGLTTAISSIASAGVVKSLALDHIVILDKIIAMDTSTLQAMRSPGANLTLLAREQNARYMNLVDRASATFGDKPSANGEFNCMQSIQNAQFAWQAKYELAKSPSNFNRDSLETYKSLYKSSRLVCDDFLKKLK